MRLLQRRPGDTDRAGELLKAAEAASIGMTGHPARIVERNAAWVADW